jgi:hypothetical protein
MKIKKGNLNFDQTGRAYPDNPHIKENWDCIWEDEGKYYKLVGDINNKEWEEVQLGEEPKQETLEEASLRIGLMEIELNHTKTLLASCEKALENRDNQAQRMYSEEEVKHIISEALQSALVTVDLEQWFKQFKKK